MPPWMRPIITLSECCIQEKDGSEIWFTSYIQDEWSGWKRSCLQLNLTWCSNHIKWSMASQMISDLNFITFPWVWIFLGGTNFVRDLSFTTIILGKRFPWHREERRNFIFSGWSNNISKGQGAQKKSICEIPEVL